MLRGARGENGSPTDDPYNFRLGCLPRGTKLYFEVSPPEAIVRMKEDKAGRDGEPIGDRLLNGYEWILPWNACGNYYFKQDSHPQVTITVWKEYKPEKPAKKPHTAEPDPGS